MESPSNLKMERKPSTGRRKIEMKLIEGESARQVTFSKRRNGLFKKASELSILCGIEVAIIVFSTSGKVYTFGHPCVDSVIGRFLTQGSTPSPVPYNLNREYIQLLNQLEAESKHAEMLKLLRKQQGGDDDLHELNLFELVHLNASMQELRKKVGKRIVELTINNHTSSPSSILDVNDMKIYGYNNASSLGHRVFGFDIERRLF